MHTLLRQTRYLLAAALIVVSPISWAMNGTPYGGFDLTKGDNKSIDFLFTIDSDPGHENGFFWAQQFFFENGPGGYLGLQKRGTDKRAIFSIWDTKASVALAEGMIAEPFTGEGDGQHVIGKFDWQPGRTYKFRLEHAGGIDPWWEWSITDLTTHEHWRLGRIQTLATHGNLSRHVYVFTEVFSHSKPCEKVGYSRATFGKPTSDNGIGTASPGNARIGNLPDLECGLRKLPGANPGVNMGVRTKAGHGPVVHEVAIFRGPQTWGEFDRKGQIGQIFRSENPATQQVEYFQLVGLNSDGRYSYFPPSGTDNGHWVSLGSTEPYYNGPITHTWSELQHRGRVWNAVDRTGNAGDIYRYDNPYTKRVEYFKRNTTTSSGQYWYFPTDATSNSHWIFLGSPASGFDDSQIPYTIDQKSARLFAKQLSPGITAYYRLKAQGPDRRTWVYPAGAFSNDHWEYVGTNIPR